MLMCSERQKKKKKGRKNDQEGKKAKEEEKEGGKIKTSKRLQLINTRARQLGEGDPGMFLRDHF